MITTYIAGPMTGLPEYNHPAFHAAARDLRAVGYTDLNPARRGVTPGKTWADYVREALEDVIQADGIAVLDGWENSRGARLETHIARELGVPVHPLSAWLDAAARADVVDEDPVIVFANVADAERYGGGEGRSAFYLGVTSRGFRIATAVHGLGASAVLDRPIPVSALASLADGLLADVVLDPTAPRLYPVSREVAAVFGGLEPDDEDDDADVLFDEVDDERDAEHERRNRAELDEVLAAADEPVGPTVTDPVSGEVSEFGPEDVDHDADAADEAEQAHQDQMARDDWQAHQ